MNVEITMKHWRCYRCRRWFGGEQDSAPCGACAQDDIARLKAEISRMARSNAALRGVLKRKRRKP